MAVVLKFIPRRETNLITNDALCRASENSESFRRAQRRGFIFKLWPRLCDLKLVHISSVQRCEMESWRNGIVKRNGIMCVYQR